MSRGAPYQTRHPRPSAESAGRLSYSTSIRRIPRGAPARARIPRGGAQARGQPQSKNRISQSRRPGVAQPDLPRRGGGGGEGDRPSNGSGPEAAAGEKTPV